MEIKILIADDDLHIRKLVGDIVKKEGYKAVFAENGAEAIDRFFADRTIDLIILDVMMPIYDGWEVLSEIREYSEVPIVMLTALGDESYEVKGLKKGADDYITKPFSYEVFIARLNTIIRKIKKDKSKDIEIDNITIEQKSRKVLVDNKDINLNKKEYELFTYLVSNKNQVITREQLINQIWGYDYDRNDRTLDTHIKTLRSKLGARSLVIKTLRGVGYMFEAGDD